MSQSERGLKYHIEGIIGTVEDKRGERPVFRIHSSDQPMAEALIKDIEERTGGKVEPFDFFDGQSKSFGFTNWKGSTWVPEGPRPNWIDPKKAN